MNIYVGNLEYRLSEEELRQAFEAFGSVESVRIITDRETGRPKGFGFVEMPNQNEAFAAINGLNGTDLSGRTVTVNEARPRGERDQAGRTPERRNDRPANRNPENNYRKQHIGNPDESSIPELLIPNATKSVMGSASPDNFHLRANAFAKWGKPDPKKNEEKFLIDKVDRTAVKTENIAKKYLDLIKKLHINNQSFNLITDSRLIVGIGSESIYEVGITLHHIYGIPYIPGQAVKGITRSYYIAEKHGGDEDKALREDDFFKEVFGSQEHVGFFVFHDAFPVDMKNDEVRIELDIMNPHYGPYYSEGKPPADYHNPKPIKFLTVAEDTKFQFILSSKEDEKAKLLDSVVKIVKEALKYHGIGAKTAVGYGYFKRSLN